MSNSQVHDPNHCQICGCLLDAPDRALESKDCGGDCLKGMAEIGEDPDARRALGMPGLGHD